jgi:F-type H+-transporting ATPase subunit b
MEFFNPHLYDLANPELWVAVGLALFFIIIVVAKVPALIAGALDEKAAKIKTDLDEAARLRAEAQAMLAELKTQRVEAEAQAKAMLKAAEEEAQRLAVEAEARLAESIARRETMAERRIAQAEANATAEVKAAAAEQAVAVAERILAARLASGAEDPLLDQAIGQIGGRLN